MNSKTVIVFFITIILLLPIYSSGNSEGSSGEETFTIYGKIYKKNGEFANLTSIKVDSMKSTWSNNNKSSPDFGTYRFEGVTAGEHVIRAYFMNDGHSVSYRKIIVDSDIELNWYVGMNWVTAEYYDEKGDSLLEEVNFDCQMNDYQGCSKILESPDIIIENSTIWENGRAEFGIYENENYYTLRTSFGGSEDASCNEIHFKLNGDTPNDFDIYQGKQSKFGYIKDANGIPLSDVVVSNGVKNVTTNNEGFYLLQNLTVGNTEILNFEKNGEQIVDPISQIINECQGWLNVSSTLEVNLPGDVNFDSSIQSIETGGYNIKWNGGDYTDYYSLYLLDDLIYRGESESYYFWSENTGSFEFRVEATNTNGTTDSSQPFLLIITPEQSNQELWSVGMNWSYHMKHTPEFQHNRTYTAIGSERINDAFGNKIDTFVLRINDDSYEDGEKSYRWVDSKNLLDIKTYWADAPSSSSYYQEGSLGWNFTETDSGMPAELFNPENKIFNDLNLHFNRTNLVGVPGHPNVYDDTHNIVKISNDVTLETPAGTFLTTYFKIIDTKDDFVSWELWYNDTVRNWVKKIDRLPGTHSDSIIYELTSFNVPTSPQFITEGGNITVKDYVIEWGIFQGVREYNLFENDIQIYQGDSLSFEINNKSDGVYNYKLIVDLNGKLIESPLLSLNIDFIQPAPKNITTIPELDKNNKVNILEGQIIEIRWEKIENIEWYSVISTDYFGDGITVEIYNGTDEKIIVDNLELGQNRIQIKVGLNNGKISDYSSSIFIVVEPLSIEELESQSIHMPISFLSSIIIMIFVAIYKRK